jgi:hypothetical protein
MFSEVRIGYGDEEVEEFVEVLKSCLSSVRPVLRRVKFCLGLGRKGNGNGGGRGRGGEWKWKEEEVREGLRDLRCVRFEGVPPVFGEGKGRALWRVLDGLRGVTDVRVETRGVLRNGELLEWICGLREVEEMSFVRSTTASMDSDLRGDVSQVGDGEREKSGVLKLRSEKRMSVGMLDFAGMDELDVLKWILAQNPVPRVRGLRIGGGIGHCEGDGRGSDDTKVMKRFFEVCGASIEQLHVDILAQAGTCFIRLFL